MQLRTGIRLYIVIAGAALITISCNQVKLGSGDGTGLVKRVDTANKMITLDHGKVGTLMQPLLMSYAVDAPGLLDNVKEGDSAAFTLNEKTPGNVVLTSIRKISPATPPQKTSSKRIK